MADPTYLHSVPCPQCGKPQLRFTRRYDNRQDCSVWLDDQGRIDVEEHEGEYELIEDWAYCITIGCGWETNVLSQIIDLLKKHDPRFKPDQSKRARNKVQVWS